LDRLGLFTGQCNEQFSVVCEEGHLPTLTAMEDDGNGRPGALTLHLSLHRKRVLDDAVWLEPGEWEGDESDGGREALTRSADVKGERQFTRVFVSERPSHGALEMIIRVNKLRGREFVAGESFAASE
jgi:hypothetical protein